MKIATKKNGLTVKSAGFVASYVGIVLLLVWIGIFKFTPTEAASIKPLVENHPLMFWLYRILSVQHVSNLIGIVEIVTGILLLIGLANRYFRIAGALCLVVTFLFTLSFLFTTPNMWHKVDGVWVTDFFILKDLPLLGFGLLLVDNARSMVCNRQVTTSQNI